MFSTAQPELEARIHALPHPQELAIFGEPISGTLPFAQQRFVGNTDGYLSVGIGVRDEQPLFDKQINKAFRAGFLIIVALRRGGKSR